MQNKSLSIPLVSFILVVSSALIGYPRSPCQIGNSSMQTAAAVDCDSLKIGLAKTDQTVA